MGKTLTNRAELEGYDQVFNLKDLNPFEKFFYYIEQYFKRRYSVVFVLVFAGLIGAMSLNRYSFWSEEAMVSSIAQNFLKTGHFTAWNGQNLSTLQGGLDLTSEMTISDKGKLPYFVAAIGIGLFGETHLGGRILFYFAGIMSLWFLSLWASKFFRESIPFALPSLLLASNISFLLYFPQCRSDSFIFFFSTLWLWSLSIVYEVNSLRLSFSLGFVAITGLALTSPLSALEMGLISPLFFLIAEFRQKYYFLFVKMAYSLLSIIFLLNGYFKEIVRHCLQYDYIDHSFKNIILILKGLEQFAFIPTILLPLLIFPFFHQKLEHLRFLTKRAILILIMIGVLCLTDIIFSPKITLTSDIAAMNNLLIILVLSSVMCSFIIKIIREGLGTFASLSILLLLITTSIFYLSQTTVSFYLRDRFQELQNNHGSGDDAFLTALKPIHSGLKVTLFPEYFLPVAQFYRPDLIYTGIIDPHESKMTSSDTLPDYVKKGKENPDFILIGLGSVKLDTSFLYFGQRYQLIHIHESFWQEKSRPDLPLHQFYSKVEDDKLSGIAVFRKIVSQ